MTPKDLALARPPIGSPEDNHPPGPPPAVSGVEMILIEERDDAVYFARIRNLGKFMSSRKLHLQKDVLENLADLVLALVGEEGSDGSDSHG